MNTFDLQPMTEKHFPAVLLLNKEWEHVTSPLDEESLLALWNQAAYRKIAVAEDAVVAFLIALREGQSYASPNYQWFEKHFQNFGEKPSSGAFLYIDRIVVSGAHQGSGIAQEFYQDIIADAREQGLEQVVCEIDFEPPNLRSSKFHDRFGFKEIGRQWVCDGKKQVSLRSKRVSGMSS